MPLLRADPPPNSRKPVTVRAIHANAGLHDWYFNELILFIDGMRDEVSRAVLAAYGAIEPQEHAMDAANPSLLLRAALRKWGGLWVSRFDKLSLDLGQAFARKSFGITQTQMRAALKDAGFTVKFAPTPGSRAAYQAVIAEQVNLIKSIPQQYLKDVETHVWQSVAKGGDMSTLSRELQKTYGVTRDRAATIARDQNNKAKATIERARRQELGITHAIWQHSAGGKVPRATHVALSGKTYLIAQGAWDSNEGKYVLPGELINCRCTSRAVIPAFETISQARANSPRNTPLLNAARSRAK
jgi:SPP1 gp7 family putative phage head morphogenesis protein